MRAHWETSEKSIYIRTVWINGVRHAILSKNDPLLKTNTGVPKRPHSCGNIIQTVKRRNKKRVSDYNRSLSMCTTSSNEVSTGIDSLESPSDVEYEYRFDSAYRTIGKDNAGESESKSRRRREGGEERSGKYKKIKLPNLNMKTNHNMNSNSSHVNITNAHTNGFNETQTNYNYFLKDNFINPITERVLNWLDLASKETNSIGFGDHMDDINGGSNNLIDENDDEIGKNDNENKRPSHDNGVLARKGGEPSGNHRGNRTSRDTLNNSVDIINNQEKDIEHNQYNQSSERNRHTETIWGSNKYAELMENSWSRHQDRSKTANVGNNVQTSSRTHRTSGNEYRGQTVETNRNAVPSRQRHGSDQHQRYPSELGEEASDGFHRIPPPTTTPTANSGASNFTFNFQTITNATKNGTDKCSSTSIPYTKNIRTNNELIRRNNENISRLVQNIDTFKKTNEIVGNNNNTSRTNRDAHNSDRVYKTNSYNINHNLNNTNTNNDKSSIELGTKSKHKKGHRKSRSNGRRNHSNRNDAARVTEHQTDDEEEYASDEDINDTFRFIIGMKSDNDGTGNPAHRYHEYGPNRTNEHTTRTNARYILCFIQDHSLLLYHEYGPKLRLARS
uniref:Uncharacterized protein n=1 Tax=Cacopsylla melanoneura TaxID=428564 RepID=A0A8D8WWX8_9HEMI